MLDALGHRFHLLIGEAALRRTVGSHAIMAAQIRQLGDILTHRDNVEIGIIPLDAEFIRQADNFVVHDDTGVAIETVTGSVETSGADEIALAVSAFDLLAGQARYGEHARALLDRALTKHVGPGI
ncbi:Scr1 family TA system antitoxin-like transcriptional regulator [Nocardia asteroides]|uniref:Scr1 family TA system antitoxin-like transcriptional regulator n=1 Tax=Nocardia asteroides TaxID=1824 RepID=UPI0033EA4B91